MAETTAPEEQATDPNATDAATDMVVESAEPAATDAPSKQKRPREEDEDEPQDDNVASKKQRRARAKKQKVEEKVQQEKENKEQEGVAEAEQEAKQEEEKKPAGPVKLGYRTFGSSVEMFDYFFNFLHAWPLNLDVNKYEHTMLLELLKNGLIDYDGVVGGGIRAFQIRRHHIWHAKCFYLIREDGSADDFSFRQCVDHILPLPEEMHPNPDVHNQLRGKRQGGRGRGGREGGRDRSHGGGR